MAGIGSEIGPARTRSGETHDDSEAGLCGCGFRLTIPLSAPYLDSRDLLVGSCHRVIERAGNRPRSHGKSATEGGAFDAANARDTNKLALRRRDFVTPPKPGETARSMTQGRDPLQRGARNFDPSPSDSRTPIGMRAIGDSVNWTLISLERTTAMRIAFVATDEVNGPGRRDRRQVRGDQMPPAS